MEDLRGLEDQIAKKSCLFLIIFCDELNKFVLEIYGFTA